MTIVSQILERMDGITKWQEQFLSTLFLAILTTHARINFTNLSRHSSLSERTYRRAFRRDFDFPNFNQETIKNAFEQESKKAFAQDASFSPKSGKKTFGIDKFWNGSASKAEKGLEVSLISIVDLQKRESFALSAEQTPSLLDLKGKQKEASRIDFYLEHLERASLYFPADVRYGLFDGFYAKRKFVSKVVSLGFQVISKLRVDADLKYLFDGEQKGQGRRRKFDGKVCFDDLSRFEKVETEEEDVTLYSLVVWSVSLKTKIRVVVVVNNGKSDKTGYVLLFSTDLRLCAGLILEYYKARFSIEFIFRDAKQFGGFSDCQARDKKALEFHFNASVASVNLARVLSRKEQEGREKFVFSMSSIKRRFYNEHLLEMFISKLDLDERAIKRHPQFESLRNYAVIAT